jgi:hypothetical protein
MSKKIVRRRAVTSDAYVEVHYYPDWSDDGYGRVDVYCLTPDPRKAQYHKPKHWIRGSTHGLTTWDWGDKTQYAIRNKFYDIAADICKELGLTSSVRRASDS